VKKKKMTILGVGKVGSALALELTDAGFKVKYLVGRDPAILNKLSKRIKGSKTSDALTSEILQKSDIVLITSRDTQIKDAVVQIQAARTDIEGKMFIHTSGSVSSAALSALKRKKAHTGSFHPIQTFNKVSTKNNKLLSGIYFGIEGDEETKKFLKKAAKKLGSGVIEMKSARKPLYHLASVMASNFLVTNINMISDVLAKAGIKDVNTYGVYKGIISQTLKNIDKNGRVDALTGPVDRNDLETISSHLEYLKKHLPEMEAFYKEASKMTSKVAKEKGSLTHKEFTDLNRFLSKK
jgi:predicted short-subunit dehydrogenase-like oxidoreductase (DUF2520 family)